ncbi:MAG: type II secretion system protein GspK [Deltaproteobacteria bacterium]|jgi:hypothetical protein
MKWSSIYRPTRKRRSRRGAIVAAPTQAPKRERRGVALIMVMVITTILSAIAADLENESQVNLAAAVNARDELQSHLHARSAVELELFVLRFQSQIKSTLGQFIPIPLFELSSFLVSSDTMKGLLDRNPTPKDDAVKDSYALNQPFGDFTGSFWVEEVVDENRKININTDDFGVGCQNFMHLLMTAVFDDPKYDVLFENLGDSRDPIRNRLLIMSNITDWTDGNEFVDPVCIVTGDTTTQGASEDTRYNHLPYNVQYEPKNGMFNSLAELRMIPGVNDAFMRLFSRYFTVWSGDGVGISMTTADPWMLRAVIRAISVTPPQPGDEEKFQKFMQERSLMLALPPPMNKMSLPIFQQLLTTAQIIYDPAKLKQLTDKKFIRFDDAANVFRITAVGRVNDASSKITLVWRDNRAQGEIVYWREE